MNTCVLDYVVQSIEELERKQFLLEAHCFKCNKETSWKREIRIRKFPKHLHINFDADKQDMNDQLPLMIEQEINLGCLAESSNESTARVEPSDEGVSRIDNIQENQIQNPVTDSTFVMKSSMFDTLTFGLLKRKVRPTIDQSTVGAENKSNVFVVKSPAQSTEVYHLTAFAISRFNPSKHTDELISYLKTKGSWLEITNSEVKSVKSIEKLLQAPLRSMVFVSYVRQTKEKDILETGDIEKHILDSKANSSQMEDPFCIPGNFDNRFLYLDRQCKVGLINKFCDHSLLKPDIQDILPSMTYSSLIQNEKGPSMQSTLSYPLIKHSNSIDGSHSALKYLANSTELPFSLTKKVLDTSTPPSLIDSVNWKKVCGDCLLSLKATNVRRIFEKAMLFNCLKTTIDTYDRIYLIESAWFQTYRDYLLPDLNIFGLKKGDLIGRLPPTSPINASIKQKMMVSSAQGESDDKIATKMFVQVNRRCFAYLQSLYKSENCVILNQKRIYVDNSESVDADLLFTVQEQCVLDQIRLISHNNIDLDQSMQANLWKLNKKINLLFEMAIDSYFKPVLSGIDLPRSAIDAHLSKTLAKFMRSFKKTQPDFKWFDPCKIIFNILNNGKIDMSFQSEASLSRNNQEKMTGRSPNSNSKGGLSAENQFEDKILDSNLFQAETNEESPNIASLNDKVKTTSGEDNRKTRTTETTAKSPESQIKLTTLKNEDNDVKINAFGDANQLEIIQVNKITSNSSDVRNDNQNGRTEIPVVAQTELFRVARDSQASRDSISMIMSKKSGYLDSKLLRKNMANIYRNANSISLINMSMGRDSIQLEDSFNYKSGMMSFFSNYDSHIEGVTGATNKPQQEETRASTEPKDMVENQTEEIEQDVKNDDCEAKPKENENLKAEDQTKELETCQNDSRVYNKSRFCKYQGDQGLNQSYAEIDFEEKNLIEIAERHLSHYYLESCNQNFPDQKAPAESNLAIEPSNWKNWHRSLSIEKMGHSNTEFIATNHAVTIVEEMLAVCDEIREEACQNFQKLVRYNIHNVIKEATHLYIDGLIAKSTRDDSVMQPKAEPAKERKESSKAQFHLNIIKDVKPQNQTEIINLAFRKPSQPSLGLFELTEDKLSQLNNSLNESRPINPLSVQANKIGFGPDHIGEINDSALSGQYTLKEIRPSNMLLPLSEQLQFFDRMSDGLLDTKLAEFEKMIRPLSSTKEGKENTFHE